MAATSTFVMHTLLPPSYTLLRSTIRRGQPTIHPALSHWYWGGFIIKPMESFMSEHNNTAAAIDQYSVIIVHDKTGGWWILSWYCKSALDERAQWYYKHSGFPLTFFLPFPYKDSWVALYPDMPITED